MKKPTNEIEVIKKEVESVVSSVDGLKITDLNSMVKATEALSLLNQYNDKVVEAKEKITKPLNAALKEARALFKPVEEKLETAIEYVRREMTDYHTKTTAAALQEADKGDLEKAVALMPVSKVETDSGSVSFIEVEYFKVIDKTKLPYDYLEPNEVEIRRQMKMGVYLDGVVYFKESRPRNTR